MQVRILSRGLEIIMANPNLFRSATRGQAPPPADAVNEAGGSAYALSAEEALATLACTGCLNDTYYADAEMQLATLLKHASECSPEYVGKVAIYARERGFMKDMPAVLCAHLATRGPAGLAVLKQVFPRAIDTMRQLRTFVQTIRSGTTGRKSLGTALKHLVQGWLNSRKPDGLFRDSVGQTPSVADLIKLSHPKPSSDEQRALYGYLCGREHVAVHLPPLVSQYEAYKKNKGAVPDVPFQMLTALDLGKSEWATIAQNAKWQMTRMNLNTFARHGVFEDPKLVSLITDRLRNPEEVRRAKAFPYQLLMAYTAATDVPVQIREALQDAMEVATENVPAYDGKVYVFVDVSGSMQSPVTGMRKGATSKVTCIEAAALIASAILRRNRTAEVIAFEHDVVMCPLNPRDSVMTNARKLASIGGGGTTCSAPLALLNAREAQGDLCILISDTESWCDAGSRYDDPSATMREWGIFKARNPRAKLVCINLQPYETSQAKTDRSILNLGGWSDAAFEVIGSFLAGGGDWASTIHKVALVPEMS